MKIGFLLTIIPNVAYHIEECRAIPEMVILDIPEENLPKLLKDALDDNKDSIYISSIVRIRE
jgi:hypothetical protein